ncbi:unnamed protein product, partial [Amoebophrya sp. A25]
LVKVREELHSFRRTKQAPSATVVGALFDFFGSDRGGVRNDYGDAYDQMWHVGLEDDEDNSGTHHHRCDVRRVLEIGIGVTREDVEKNGVAQGDQRTAVDEDADQAESPDSTDLSLAPMRSGRMHGFEESNEMTSQKRISASGASDAAAMCSRYDSAAVSDDKIEQTIRAGARLSTVSSESDYTMPAPNRRQMLDEIGSELEDVDARASRYRKGAGLFVWREFFPNAVIHGVDLEPAAMIRNEPRIRTHVLNTVDLREVDAFLKRLTTDEENQRLLSDSSEHINTVKVTAVEQKKSLRIHQAVPPSLFDFIIDDGLHDNLANRALLAKLWPHLDARGIYVIEDLRVRWRKREMLLETVAPALRLLSEDMQCRPTPVPIRLHKEELLSASILGFEHLSISSEKFYYSSSNQSSSLTSPAEVQVGSGAAGYDPLLEMTSSAVITSEADVPTSLLEISKAGMQRNCLVPSASKTGTSENRTTETQAEQWREFLDTKLFPLPQVPETKVQEISRFFSYRRDRVLKVHGVQAVQGLWWRNSTQKIAASLDKATAFLRISERISPRWCCGIEKATSPLDDASNEETLLARQLCWTDKIGVDAASEESWVDFLFHNTVTYCVPLFVNYTTAIVAIDPS